MLGIGASKSCFELKPIAVVDLILGYVAAWPFLGYDLAAGMVTSYYGFYFLTSALGTLSCMFNTTKVLHYSTLLGP